MNKYKYLQQLKINNYNFKNKKIGTLRLYTILGPDYVIRSRTIGTLRLYSSLTPEDKIKLSPMQKEELLKGLDEILRI